MLSVCLLVGSLATPSVSLGQYRSYPATDGFAPHSSSPPWYDSSTPVEYQLGGAPGDTGPMPPNRVDGQNSYPATMRSTPFLPARPASYARDDNGPPERPTQTFGGPSYAPWGPPPDIHASAPEGARNPVPSPRAEPAAPINETAVQPESGGPQSGPENELFEPNPDDLKGYIWYQPSTWEDFGWDTTIQLGMNGSAGNSRTNSLKAGFKTERETEKRKFLFEIVHNRAATEDLSTQNNVLGKIRFDRKLGESRWSLFAQGTTEYDEFKDFDARLAGNMGVNYKFIKTETTTLAGDFGSGVSHEIGGVDGGYTPEAVFALELKHKLSKRQQLSVKSEYFPDWTNFSSYRLVTDAGWELLLDEEWGLNLKIGVIDRYDSTPFSRKPNDLDYSMLLLWKL